MSCWLLDCMQSMARETCILSLASAYDRRCTNRLFEKMKPQSEIALFHLQTQGTASSTPTHQIPPPHQASPYDTLPLSPHTASHPLPSPASLYGTAAVTVVHPHNSMQNTPKNVKKPVQKKIHPIVVPVQQFPM